MRKNEVTKVDRRRRVKPLEMFATPYTELKTTVDSVSASVTAIAQQTHENKTKLHNISGDLDALHAKMIGIQGYIFVTQQTFAKPIRLVMWPFVTVYNYLFTWTPPESHDRFQG